MKRGLLTENGATILDFKHSWDDYIVICFRPNHPFDNFVTWKSDEEGNCWSGHYYSDLQIAVGDFVERIY